MHWPFIGSPLKGTEVCTKEDELEEYSSLSMATVLCATLGGSQSTSPRTSGFLPAEQTCVI